MFIDLDNRQKGKTTTLIHDAYFTGLPIVVANRGRKDNIVKQAQSMGVEVIVFTVSELKDESKGSDTLRDISGVLVDELEDVLFQALGVRVVKANMSRTGRV